MCDFSLYAYRNRLAEDNDELVTYRFSSGCTGFVDLNDLASPPGIRFCGIGWNQLKSWFFPRLHHGPVAVCLATGSRLRLAPVSQRLQQDFELGEVEEVTFTQFDVPDFNYRDGLRFGDGKEALLQRVPSGQRARVISTRPADQERDLAQALASSKP